MDSADGWAALEEQPEKQPEEKKRHRKASRYAVPWRVVIVYKKFGKRTTYDEGRIADLSTGGVSLYSDVNIYSTEPVVITIEIPPYSNRQKSIIVGAKCSLFCSILSSNYGKFRLILKFLDFDRSGKRDLTEALSGRTALDEYGNPFI